MVKQNKKSTLVVILTIIASTIGWYMKNKDSSLLDTLSSAANFTLDGLTPVKVNGDTYEILENCTLVNHKHNDGDSFHIKHAKGQSEIRLYFVDTAESAYKTYAGGKNNGERLDQQGKYFGGLSRDQTANLGQLGKERTMSLIKGVKFKVITKWQKVTNKQTEKRIHAFIILEKDDTEYYLHELLTQEGLVRLSTWGSDLPDGTSWKTQKERLIAMENDAKKRKVGAWGINQ